jgi:hypothetical protein
MAMSWISEGIITNPKIRVRDAGDKLRKHFPRGAFQEKMPHFKSRFPYELLRKLQDADNGKAERKLIEPTRQA